MKRSEFFKTLGLGITGAAVAPSLLREIEAVKEHVKTDEGKEQAKEVCKSNYGHATGIVWISSACPENLNY